MTLLDLEAELGAAAAAWRTWCAGPQRSIDMDDPLVVLLLASLGEPPAFGPRFTGDLVTDLLGAAQGAVHRMNGNPSGPEAVEGWELARLDRLLGAVVALRSRALGSEARR